MGLAKVPQLDAMLQVPEESVGGGQAGVIGSLDKPVLHEGIEGFECPPASQIYIEPTVDELKELDGEFDVTDPTPGPFDVGWLSSGLDLLFELADAA
jgi:hypothetical protein